MYDFFKHDWVMTFVCGNSNYSGRVCFYSRLHTTLRYKIKYEPELRGCSVCLGVSLTNAEGL